MVPITSSSIIIGTTSTFMLRIANGGISSPVFYSTFKVNSCILSVLMMKKYISAIATQMNPKVELNSST